MISNSTFLKKTVVINILLIVIVGAVHTFAVAAMIYQQSSDIDNIVSESISFDVIDLSYFGESSESTIEASTESDNSNVQESPLETKPEEIITVKTTGQSDIVELKAHKTTETMKMKPPQRSQKQSSPIKSNTLAHKPSQQKLQGGQPFVTANRIQFIKNPSPTRPRVAHRKGWRGHSIVLLEIGINGVPISVRLERTSGYDILDKAALEAAQGVKIHPYIENGQAIAIRHRIDYAF